MLNRHGWINEITLGIVEKFAKKRKDIILLELIQNLKERWEELDMERDAKKYNI